jgi:DNA-binding IclR family transcriptional regulator
MPSSELVQSLSRGLSILERIAGSEGGLTLAQVGGEVGLKGPTAHNLLRTLAAHGFVEKVARPTRYRLGPAATRLTERQRQRLIVQRVEAALMRLHASHPRARFSFAEAVGGEVVVTARVSPELPGQLQRDTQQSMSPYTSASALLCQAMWPAEMRAAYRRRYPFSEYGSHAWPTLAAVDEAIDGYRRRRCADPKAGDDSVRLATAVCDGDGRFVGALGAYLPSPDAAVGTVRSIRRDLIDAAAAIGAGAAGDD